MTAHHVITTLLVLSSYVVHFTRVGNMVLVVMDVADVVLCTAKCMKYLGERLAKLCDFVFGVFIVVWVVTRHVIYCRCQGGCSMHIFLLFSLFLLSSYSPLIQMQ